jgi:hypothetical protein
MFFTNDYLYLFHNKGFFVFDIYSSRKIYNKKELNFQKFILEIQTMKYFFYIKDYTVCDLRIIIL